MRCRHPFLTTDPNKEVEAIHPKAMPVKVEAGSVLLPRDAEFLHEFLCEIAAFPGSRHDDQVDSMTLFLVWSARWQFHERPPERPNPTRPPGRSIRGHPPGGRSAHRPGSGRRRSRPAARCLGERHLSQREIARLPGDGRTSRRQAPSPPVRSSHFHGEISLLATEKSLFEDTARSLRALKLHRYLRFMGAVWPQYRQIPVISLQNRELTRARLALDYAISHEPPTY
jgi:hypothetical protein